MKNDNDTELPDHRTVLERIRLKTEEMRKSRILTVRELEMAINIETRILKRQEELDQVAAEKAEVAERIIPFPGTYAGPGGESPAE